MSIFLRAEQLEAILHNKDRYPFNELYRALHRRVKYRTAAPGLTDLRTTTDWWFHTADYISDAAMVYALTKEERIGIWIRDVVTSVMRRPVDDIVGPVFRDHVTNPPKGHLETAHITWAVVAALDLARPVFSEAEIAEAEIFLREVCYPLCRRGYDSYPHLHNWRVIFMAAIAQIGAAFADRQLMDEAVELFNFCSQVFQADGSYGESLQYSNYTIYAMIMAYEALTGRDAALAARLPITVYARTVRWMVHSFFYRKPLPGWGQAALPRAANFNDSAAIFKPTADVLLHFASRFRATDPLEAGLASWFFQRLYLPIGENITSDQGTFGLMNDFGFLALPLLTEAAPPLAPETIQLSTLGVFSNGDVVTRDDWDDSGTILAIHGGSELLNTAGHLHGDLNSFILVHNRERLLVDPGHSCYRNLLHEVEASTGTHNTCQFSYQNSQGEKVVMAQQKLELRRLVVDGQLIPPLARGGQRLLAERLGDLSVIASEVAAVYGKPLQRFTRFWFLLHPHVLFVVDWIEAEVPVKTTWNWLINNRDGKLEYDPVTPQQLTVYKGNSGMKLSHFGTGSLTGPEYAYVHDVYHPLPAQRGEGITGSGYLFHINGKVAFHKEIAVHAIVMDTYGGIEAWELNSKSADRITATNRQSAKSVSLKVNRAEPSFTIDCDDQPRYRIEPTTANGGWRLVPISMDKNGKG